MWCQLPYSPWPKGQVLQLANRFRPQGWHCAFRHGGQIPKRPSLRQRLGRLFLATVTAFAPLLREDIVNSLGRFSPFVSFVSLFVVYFCRNIKSKNDPFQLRARITRVFANDKCSLPWFQRKYLSSRKEHLNACGTYFYKTGRKHCPGSNRGF